MMPVRIVTDSTCDLPAETIARYRIRIVPLYINVGKESFLDGIDITREEFYTRLPSFPEHPTTAVPSPQKFHAIYEALAEEGATEILSIHISTALSAVLDVARIAAQETTSVPVTVVDSQQLSLGTGFLVETAAKLAAAGSSIAEILEILDAQIKRTYVFAVIDTLEFLKRSGRMNGFISNIGTLIQIKPILSMHNGKPGTERVRTRERARKRLFEMVTQFGEIERIAIVHTNALLRVAELQNQAASFLSNQIQVSDITPVIGAHLGPGAFGFAVISK
jgi:DegV family protein with EDD domain